MWVKNKRGDILMQIDGMSIKFPPSKEYVALVGHCRNGQEVVLEAYQTAEEAVNELREFEKSVRETEIVHEIGYTGVTARVKKLNSILSGNNNP